jgi:LysM repeat protein
VDRLTAENLLLHQQLDVLRAQGAANASLTPEPIEPARMEIVSTVPHDAAGPAPGRRMHVVRPRETISAIAAECGVKASAILAANPGVEPRRLRIGQSLNLP